MGKSKKSKPLRDSSTSSSDSYDWKSSPPDKSDKIEKLNDDNAFDELLQRVTVKKNKNSIDASSSDQPNVSELNPYWDKGEGGLPSINAINTQTTILCEANKSWLRRAFIRAEEEAIATNKTSRDILLERWNESTVNEMEHAFGKHREKHLQNISKDSKKIEARWKRNVNQCVASNIHPVVDEPNAQNKSVKQTPSSIIGLSNSEAYSSHSKQGVEVITSKEIEERYVTDNDINSFSAKLMKAEFSGNKNKIEKLKEHLEKMRQAKRRHIKIRLTKNLTNTSSNLPQASEKVIQLTTSDRFGQEIPLHIGAVSSNPPKIRCESIQSHDDKGVRKNYFKEDESTTTVEELIRQERFESAKSSDYEFITMAGKCRLGAEDEYDDCFIGKKARSQEVTRHRQKSDAISDYKRKAYSQSKCLNCLEQTARHLVIDSGQRVFLSLPDHVSLTLGHCYITPIEHIGAMTRVDESAVEEAFLLKKRLCNLASTFLGLSQGSYIFLEVASYPDSYKHHVKIECIPVDENTFHSLPLYFKKALEEMGSEWDQNKRVVSLVKTGMGAREAIPPNFGYFAVEFGTSGVGFAKVIENWQTFPMYFGREVIAGSLEKSPEHWRKPKRDSLDNLRRKVVEFEKLWEVSDNGCSFGLRTKIDESETEGPALPPSMT